MSKSLIINKKTQIIKNSDYMKIVIASLYRFVLNYKYTTTEFDLKDVCACNKNYSVEIECKISKSDLKNELKSKNITHMQILLKDIIIGFQIDFIMQ